jgi:hypothetical protein
MNDVPQTWKACWGQPLKSSNLLSSAPLTRANAEHRPLSESPFLGGGLSSGSQLQDGEMPGGPLDQGGACAGSYSPRLPASVLDHWPAGREAPGPRSWSP